MINYEYEYLFYEHKSVDYIITDPDATITPVVNSAPIIADYKFLITNEELRNESIALSESICSDRNLKFGKTEAAKFSFTFRTEGKDYQSDLTGEEIVVYLYFNGNSSTLFQVGRYTIQSDQYTNDRTIRNITAYDILYSLNDYDITEWYNANLSDIPVAISTLRTSLFNWLSTSEGFNISQESTSLVNDSVTLTNNIESDVITFEFFMQRVLEVNGCFGHINRQGIFEYKYINRYDSTSVKLLENSDREPVLQYEPYTVKGIAYINAYDRDNIRIGRVGSSNFKRPNIYSIVDSFALNDVSASSMASVLSTMLNKVTHLRYRPMTARIMGNLCLEVGDKVDIQYGIDEEDDPIAFYTYIFSRSFRGIQAMRDIISAKGDQTQPEYVIQERWHQGDSNRGTSGSGRSGISEIHDDYDEHCINKDRNKGFRYLDEPDIIAAEYDAANGKLKVKWEDPTDLTDDKPCKCFWNKTYVVKSEGAVPRNIYEGTIIETETVRDSYKTNWFEVTVEKNKRYYFAFMPEDTKEDVRWTKVISLDTSEEVLAPTITSLEMGGASDWDGSEVAILYSGDNNSLTVQVSNGHIVFKLYSGSTEIYSFTSPVGSGVNDVDKIHVSFIKDDANYYAKPSFIYETAEGVYSYNQESPSSSTLRDIYGWLMQTVDYSLETLLKSSDMSHQKSASGWDWSPLEQYFGTDWNLNMLTSQNSRAIERNGTEYHWSISLDGNNDTYSRLPLKKTVKLAKIKASFRKASVYNANWNVAEITCYYYDGSTFTNVGKLSVVGNTTKGDYDYNITDTNYHTFEKTFIGLPEFNYVQLNYAGQVTYIKDILLTVIE